MTQTDDLQITPDLTFSQFEVMKAIPKGHIFMKLNEPGTWRSFNGRNGYVVTTSMRSLIERGLVKANEKHDTDRRRRATITQAGYIAMSKAARHKPTKRKR